MPKPLKQHSRYMAGLDGLRALAVFAVIAYHLNLSWAPGGLLGVGIFFVLSGYLITDLLLTQWRANRKLDLKDFWLRRARRLLPGLFLMVSLVILWVSFFGHAFMVPLRGDVFPALLYISNWWLIFHHVSYFASFGPASPLGHLWSLAVEEQFYLLWPLLLMLGLRFKPKHGWLVIFTLLLALASAFTMAVLYQPGSDPSRVYYGTDTRAFGLLFGAILAFVWPSQKLNVRVSQPVRLVIDFIGGIGLLMVLLMIYASNQYDDFLYRGGFVLLSLAAAMTVAGIAHPASRLGRVFGWAPLRYLGVRSYGIYLWHYPVIVLTTPVVDTGGFNLSRAALQVAASIVLAALSWRFVEDPIRHGAIGRLLLQARAQRWHLRARWIASASALIIISVSCVSCLARPIQNQTTASAHTNIFTGIGPTQTVSAAPIDETAPTHTSDVNQIQVQIQGQGQGISPSSMNRTTIPQVKQDKETSIQPDTSGNAKTNANQIVEQANSQGKTTETNKPAVPQNGNQTTNQSNTSTSTKAGSGAAITAIGDSVMIDIAPYLETMLPGIVIDGKVGRQMYQAPDVVTQLKSKGELGNTVIIELGTNGSFSKSQLESLLRSLGNATQIVLVNTRVPRPWESTVNSTLAEVAATYPNTTLVDWYHASANHNSYFYTDGVHLNPEGSKVYASLVVQAIQTKSKS